MTSIADIWLKLKTIIKEIAIMSCKFGVLGHFPFFKTLEKQN